MSGWRGRLRRITSFQRIILGFIGVILLGAILLTLPISARSRTSTPFLQSLFTAVSATCVTGLVVADTATHWSVFGQVVILLLIQIGGLGVMTVAASVTRLTGKRITLRQRSAMVEAISAPMLGGVVNFVSFAVKLTLIAELTGAAVMMPVFCRDFGWKGIWMAVFHSISAFCNAGFDLMGSRAAYSSLTSYSTQPLINIAIMTLIVCGGLGFVTWEDITRNRLQLHRYRMQSKVVLCAVVILILAPALTFFVVDLRHLPLGERILGSFFQSVTTRTAGFNTVDLNRMTGAGRGLMILLMLIGGAPGSTAGGIKTTTLAVLVASAIAVFRRREDTEFFGRRVDPSAIRTAAAVLMLDLILFFGGGILISLAENLPMDTCLFETASAVGTVGLTLGVTPGLSGISLCVLIVLMFLGRVGGLTMIYAAFSGTAKPQSRLPQEQIAVG